MNDGTRSTVLVAARRECERRLQAGQQLHDIERYIDGLPVSADARAALWLWAWSWRDRPAGAGTRRGRRALS